MIANKMAHEAAWPNPFSARSNAVRAGPPPPPPPFLLLPDDSSPWYASGVAGRCACACCCCCCDVVVVAAESARVGAIGRGLGVLVWPRLQVVVVLCSTSRFVPIWVPPCALAARAEPRLVRVVSVIAPRVLLGCGFLMTVAECAAKGRTEIISWAHASWGDAGGVTWS